MSEAIWLRLVENVCRAWFMKVYRMKLREAIDGAELGPSIDELLRRWVLCLEDISGMSREPHVVRVRHAIWKMLVEHGYSVQTVAKMCNRNHTTVLSALKKLKASA